MNIYLAGPMRGLPEHNFPAFYRWADILEKQGHTVFNPANKGDEARLTNNPELQNELSFRRHVFNLDTDYICKKADAVYLMPGWANSLGAKAEKALAEAIGLKVEYLDPEAEEYKNYWFIDDVGSGA